MYDLLNIIYNGQWVLNNNHNDRIEVTQRKTQLTMLSSNLKDIKKFFPKYFILFFCMGKSNELFLACYSSVIKIQFWNAIHETFCYHS